MTSLVDGIIEKLILRLRRADKWKEAEALVYSCTWTDNSGGDANVGLTTVTYSYRAAGELQSGEVTWIDSKGVDVYHKGDLIIIRFDPYHPSRSYFPEKQHLPLGILAGALFALAVMLILFLGTIVLRSS